LPVYAIPGNHDYGGPGSLWEQSFFRRECEKLAPNFHLLLEPVPVVLEGAVLLPCPLMRRHTRDDLMGWLRHGWGDRAVELGGLPRIVLAHGSVHGFSSGGDDEDEGLGAANRLEWDELPAEEIDYGALGDWHGCKQVGERAWYAGTPEPDRFPRGDQQSGQVLVVTAARGAVPEVRPVRTGRLLWHTVAATLTGEESLAALEARLDELLGGRAQQDLVRLELDGSLGLEALARLEGVLETLEARLLRLRLHQRVVPAPTAEEAAALARREGDPLIARVAARLLEAAAGHTAATGEAEIARAALRHLHWSLQSPATHSR